MNDLTRNKNYGILMHICRTKYVNYETNNSILAAQQ